MQCVAFDQDFQYNEDNVVSVCQSRPCPVCRLCDLTHCTEFLTMGSPSFSPEFTVMGPTEGNRRVPRIGLQWGCSRCLLGGGSSQSPMQVFPHLSSPGPQST